MSVLLCVKMDVACSEQDFEKVTKSAFPPAGVQMMLELPTLQWKIWGVNPDRKQCTGVYLFASREAAEDYTKMVVPMLQERRGIYNVTTNIWAILEEETRITKGPIDVPQIADLAE